MLLTVEVNTNNNDMIDMDRMYTQLISKRKGSDKRGIAYEKKI